MIGINSENAIPFPWKMCYDNTIENSHGGQKIHEKTQTDFGGRAVDAAVRLLFPVGGRPLRPAQSARRLSEAGQQDQ